MCMQSQKDSFSQGQEDSLQAINRATNDFRHVAQRWKNKLTLKGHSITELYMPHGLAVICDLNIVVPLAEVRGDMWMDNKPIGNSEVRALVVYRSKPCNVRVFEMRNQEPVFVVNVETMKTPDGLAAPSFVRLYDIHNEIDDFCRGMLFQSAIDGRFKLLNGIANGEHSAMRRIDGNLDERMIESRSEIMQGIPKNENQLVWKGINTLQLNNITSALQVRMGVDNVRVFLHESEGFEVKIIDVMFGPFNL